MTTSAMSQSRQTRIPLFSASMPRGILIVIVAFFYYMMARLGLLLAFQHTNASPVWLPSGLAFAAVLALGNRVWPGIWLGAFVANLSHLSQRGIPLPLLIAVCTLIGAGNTLEALTGKLLLNRLIGAGDPFDQVRHVFTLVGITLVMCLVSASIGPTALCLTGIVSWKLYQTMAFTWWCGDVAGILLLTPILLTWWYQPRLRRDSPQRLMETAVLAVMLVIVARVAFSAWVPVYLQNPKAYLIIPVLLWVACHFDRGEAMTSVALISGLAIWATMHGLGPFAQSSLNASLLSVQGFICVVAMTVLALTAALMERQRAEEAKHAVQTRYQDLYDYAPDLMASVDVPSLHIVQCNQTMADVLGYPKEQIAGRSLLDFCEAGSATKVRGDVLPVLLERGGVRDVEMQLQSKNGTLVDVSLSMSGIRDESGRIVRTRSIWRDINARKRLEDQLRTLNESLEQRVEERTRVLEETNSSLMREIAERQVVERELRQVKQDLEHHKRDLESKIEKLELLNRVMMEREGRIVQLKAELKRLQSRPAGEGSSPAKPTDGVEGNTYV